MEAKIIEILPVVVPETTFVLTLNPREMQILTMVIGNFPFDSCEYSQLAQELVSLYNKYDNSKKV